MGDMGGLTGAMDLVQPVNAGWAGVRRDGRGLLIPSWAEVGVPHGAELLAKLVVQRLKLDYIGAIWQSSAILDRAGYDEGPADSSWICGRE